jgi:uncharacterized membrane protein YfcA
MSVGWIGLVGVGIGMVAGTLGSGGSIFTLLLLIHLAGLGPTTAITTSMVIVAGTSAIAIVPYARAGAVMWEGGLRLAAVSVVGAYVGGRLSTKVPPDVLMAIFAATVFVAAAMMLLSPAPLFSMRSRTSLHGPIVSAIALLVGTLTGAVGLGGGFAIVPLLVSVGGTSVRSAVGTALFVRGLNTLAGLAGHYPQLVIHWPLTVYVGVATSVGSVIGAQLHARLRVKTVQHAFAVITMVIAAAVILDPGVRRGR